MERTVIDEVAEKIGKTPSEVWALVCGGLIYINYGPRWTEEGDSNDYTIHISIGKKGNN